jgi:hypothetical protein
MVRYEDMMAKPVETAREIEKFLEISLETEKIEKILWRYARENPEGDRRGLHFNKAISHRYMTDMSREQKDKCRLVFEDYLEPMGYANE